MHQAMTEAEMVARDAYGRLVALLAAPTRDIAAAEDALGDAFERALRVWPESGVPDSPEAWLLTVARNRQRDWLGSAAHRLSVPLDELLTGADGPDDSRAAAFAAPASGSSSAAAPVSFSGRHLSPEHEGVAEPDEIPDKRLALLFVCAHPAVDPSVRTALMLQTVLGFEAQQIAEAFAVPAPAMAQRLVRAKRRIRDAGIPFAVPDRPAMPVRLPPVLEAIYGAYSIEWQRVSGETLRESLAAEALYLASTLADLLPEEPEVQGLVALLCLSIARTDARTGPCGEWIALEAQDTALWNRALIARGEAHLRRAHALATRPSRGAAGGAVAGAAAGAVAGAASDRVAATPDHLDHPQWPFGRFQLEAAMQSAHCARATTGETDWLTLRALNEALVRIAPTLGAQVSLASTIAETDGPEAALNHLDALVAAAESLSASAAAALNRFQPAWATRAHLLAAAGRRNEALEAYDRTLALTTDPALRAHLALRRNELQQRPLAPQSSSTSPRTHRT
jgi:RNA polymerase sigma-70 factor (ECF subfamily)